MGKNWRALGASNESKMSKIQKKVLTFDCQFVVAGVDEVPNAEEHLGQMPLTFCCCRWVSSDLLKR